jgi:ribosomal-protein-alanine N-acetyltransferase
MIGYLVREATEKDIGAMRSIAKESKQAAQWSEDEYRRMIANDFHTVLVAIDEVATKDQLCGFIAAHAIGEEWEIENIAVAEKARRQGIASLLVQQVLAAAREQGAEAVYLEVRNSNAAARKLYEICGFAESGRRPNYYSDPAEDAVLYELKIVDAALDSALKPE